MATTTTTTTRKPATAPHGTARLTLHINGVGYGVRPLHPEDPEIVRAFRLRRLDTGDAYDVAALRDHHTCTCADSEFRRVGIDPAGCKHARALTALGLLDAPRRAPR